MKHVSIFDFYRSMPGCPPRIYTRGSVLQTWIDKVEKD